MNQIQKRTFKSIFSLFVGLLLWTNTAQAQELKLSFTTTAISGAEYSPRHIIAVWVKSSAGVYQRTLIVYASERKGYLYKWQSNSGGDKTDAITGATFSAIKAHSVTWNLKNIAGKQLQPGSYVLCMEMTSKDGQGPYREIPFNVGTSNYTLTPEDGSNFKSISIDFKNSTTGINDQSILQAEDFLKVLSIAVPMNTFKRLNALSKNRLAITTLFLCLFATTSSYGQAAAFDSTLLLMGTRFELKAISNNQVQAREAVLAGIEEINRIETLISSHKASTQTTRINQNAGITPVTVDAELYNLITRCIKVSKLTDGAFDITFGALYRIWKFDGSMKTLPTADTIQKYQNRTGYQKIEIDPKNHTIFLPEKEMSIGFGAIGKGYAANRAKQIMVKMGAHGGFVNAAGDILFWGHNELNQKWNVAIASPFFQHEVIGGLEAENKAVVTSGNYEKNFTIDGKTYSHIIDPKTGYPTTEAVSVTIIGPDAELADALATAVSVLGVSDGLKLINQLNGFECLIIDSKGSFHQSNGLALVFYSSAVAARFMPHPFTSSAGLAFSANS